MESPENQLLIKIYNLPMTERQAHCMGAMMALFKKIMTNKSEDEINKTYLQIWTQVHHNVFNQDDFNDLTKKYLKITKDFEAEYK